VTAANQKNSACNDAVCMRLIAPERVLESVRGVLNGTKAKHDLVPIAALRS
jgi:hypothetical protein